MTRIFIVEDNASIREAAASYLKVEEYEVLEFDRLTGVEEAFSLKAPDLLILDVMLPDGDGFLFAKRLRKKYDTPIMFLTARNSESDRIMGFDVGGDDYLVKPFSPKEMVLRVKAILRRSSGSKETGNQVRSWKLGKEHLEIHPEAYLVMLKEKEVPLTTAEWKILLCLAENSKAVISRQRLLGELDYLAEGSERTIDTHIKNIRSKLGPSEWIETVRGFGYRFSGAEE